MIPVIGILIAVYCVARLIQVPIENSGWEKRWALLLVVSIPAIIAIGVLALDLLLSGTKTNLPSTP